MTFTDLQKANLVMFAAHQVGERGSLEQMKAICYCIRNRARAGWYDGSWFLAIQHAQEHSAHPFEEVMIDPSSRAFQRLTRDIDEIFFGDQGVYGGDDVGPDLSQTLATQKYWCFLNRPFLPSFQEKIIADKKNHANTAQMGLMMFYE